MSYSYLYLTNIYYQLIAFSLSLSKFNSSPLYHCYNRRTQIKFYIIKAITTEKFTETVGIDPNIQIILITGVLLDINWGSLPLKGGRENYYSWDKQNMPFKYLFTSLITPFFHSFFFWIVDFGSAFLQPF